MTSSADGSSVSRSSVSGHSGGMGGESLTLDRFTLSFTA